MHQVVAIAYIWHYILADCQILCTNYVNVRAMMSMLFFTGSLIDQQRSIFALIDGLSFARQQVQSAVVVVFVWMVIV